jgi:hypothetical protein
LKEFLAQDGAAPLLAPKRGRVISASVELNPVATCRDSACPFLLDSSAAEAAAYDHAQDTGHAVVVDYVRRQVVMAP